jgi:hypothetical protein
VEAGADCVAGYLMITMPEPPAPEPVDALPAPPPPPPLFNPPTPP